MNIDTIKYNLIYHLVADYNYRMIMSKDGKSIWALNSAQKQFPAVYIQFSNGQVYPDELILRVVSQVSLDAVNSVTKLCFDHEIATSSAHVHVINFTSDPLTCDNQEFSALFPSWSKWVDEASSLSVDIINNKIKQLSRVKQKQLLKQQLPKLSLGISALCAVVYLITLLITNTIGSSSLAAILMGGLYKPYVFGLHQYYRIITAGFLHVSILHLLINIINFIYLGKVIEPLFKKKWMYLVLLVLGIIGGNLLALIGPNQSITLGLSSGMYALLGFYTVYSFEHHYFKNKMYLRNYIYMMVINLYISFLPTISLAGHLGGFITGLLFGLVLSHDTRFKPLQLHIRICTALLVIILIGFVIYDSSNYLSNPSIDAAMKLLCQSNGCLGLYGGL